MARGHKHWPEDHPFYPMAPVHETTKKECDLRWTEYMHGHEGEACVKQVKPGNQLATCILKDRVKEATKDTEDERRQAAFEAFIEKEERRIATLLGSNI